MTNVQFGKLEEISLREAWAREDTHFTPWLAENIDRLSEVIGIPLELTGTEVAVETFAADILARNPSDGTVVLIENQFTPSDHTHLGQIMTYLTGLSAQTIIWIAPGFREPHTSAIKWLNEHTADGFSFFAVKVRVVRIGDSPFAPIFEIVEKPNAWERALTEKKRKAGAGGDQHSATREAFWQHYLERHPDAAEGGVKVQRAWNAYTVLAGGDIRISVWIGEKTCGIFVRGDWGERKFSASERLAWQIDRIADSLDAEVYDPSHNGYIFGAKLEKSYHDEANWNEICDWLEQRRKAYAAAISAALEQTP